MNKLNMMLGFTLTLAITTAALADPPPHGLQPGVAHLDDGVAMGGQEGHGGGAWVGYYRLTENDEPGEVHGGDKTVVEFLDLWESRSLHAQTLVDFDRGIARPIEAIQSHEIIKKYVAYAMQRLHEFDQELAERVGDPNELLRIMVPTLPGVEILAPRDANATFGKPGSSLKGLASYDDILDRLVVDNRLVGGLIDYRPRDVAALLVHEAIYKTLRDKFDDPDSVLTRKIVAKLFGTEKILPIPQAQSGSVLCKGWYGNEMPEKPIHMEVVVSRNAQDPKKITIALNKFRHVRVIDPMSHVVEGNKVLEKVFESPWSGFETNETFVLRGKFENFRMKFNFISYQNTYPPGPYQLYIWSEAQSDRGRYNTGLRCEHTP